MSPEAASSAGRQGDTARETGDGVRPPGPQRDPLSLSGTSPAPTTEGSPPSAVGPWPQAFAGVPTDTCLACASRLAPGGQRPPHGSSWA